MSQTTQPQNNNLSNTPKKKVYKTSEAQRRANKLYREKNKDKLLKYRIANKEKLHQYQKSYREKNRELLKERVKVVHQKNGKKDYCYSKEKKQAYCNKFRKENRGKCIEYNKKWIKNNPEKAKESQQKSFKKWSDKQDHFYKFTKDTGLSFYVEILKMNRVEAKNYAELNKMEYVKC